MKRKSVTTKTLLHIAAIAAIFLINNAPLKAQTIFPSPAVSKDEQPQKITFTQEEILSLYSLMPLSKPLIASFNL